MKDYLKLLLVGVLFAVINIALMVALFLYLFPKMGYFGWVVAAIFFPFAAG